MKQITPVVSNTALFTSILAVGTLASVAMLSYTFADESEKKAEREETRIQIETAIENGNYADFQALAEGTPMAENITEENFSVLQELHNVKTEIKTLEEELGLPDKQHGQKGKRGERGERGDRENNK